jgi:cholestenol delta-isomerase
VSSRENNLPSRPPLTASHTLFPLKNPGYVVVTPEFYKDTSGSYLSDAWKEYTKADSRYATRDDFIVSMEAVTAFLWGPLCPLIVYGIFAAKPWRFTLMALVSLGQIYGDVLYYGTCFLEGFVHSRPEPAYFWGFFVALNAIWIIIPGYMLAYAAKNLNAAVATTEGSGAAAGRVTRSAAKAKAK